MRAATFVWRTAPAGLLVVAALALAAAYQTRAPITLEMASADEVVPVCGWGEVVPVCGWDEVVPIFGWDEVVPIFGWDEDIYLTRGFYPPEETAGVTHRWTSGDAQIVLPGLGSSVPLRLRIHLQAFRPPLLSPKPVTISLNDRQAIRLTPGVDLAAYDFDLPPDGIDLRGDALLGLQSDTFVPSQTMTSSDERTLGLLVDRVTLEYGPGLIVPPVIVWALLTGSVLSAYGFARTIGRGIRASLNAGLLLLAIEIMGVVAVRTWTAHNSPWLAATVVSLYVIALRLKKADRAAAIPASDLQPLTLTPNSNSNSNPSAPLRTGFKFIFAIFLAWRAALVVIPIVGTSIVGVPECCPQVDPEPLTSWSQAAFEHWYRWDAIWYGSIAQDGYQYHGTREASNVAFFPFFPLVAGLTGRLTGLPVEAAGPLVSTALAFAACLLLHRLARRETGDPETAARSVVYLLAFPAAYYLAIGYSEALYLLCVVAAFGWAREGRWGWCGVASCLAGLARLHGALLVVTLGYEYLRQRGFRLRVDAIGVLGAPLGVLAFMGYLGLQFGQPLAYFEVQALFFKGGRIEAFPTFPGATLAKFLHGALIHPPSTEGVIVIGATLWLLILTLEVWARLPRAYGVYLLAIVLFSLTSGDLISMPRFVAPMFPGFIALGLIGRRPWADRAILIVSVALQGVLALMFANGYWIA